MPSNASSTLFRVLLGVLQQFRETTFYLECSQCPCTITWTPPLSAVKHPWRERIPELPQDSLGGPS